MLTQAITNRPFPLYLLGIFIWNLFTTKHKQGTSIVERLLQGEIWRSPTHGIEGQKWSRQLCQEITTNITSFTHVFHLLQFELDGVGTNCLSMWNTAHLGLHFCFPLLCFFGCRLKTSVLINHISLFLVFNGISKEKVVSNWLLCRCINAFTSIDSSRDCKTTSLLFKAQYYNQINIKCEWRSTYRIVTCIPYVQIGTIRRLQVGRKETRCCRWTPTELTSRLTWVTNLAKKKKM